MGQTRWWTRTLAGVSSKLAPRYWGGHLLALVAVGVALWLGLWQYGAWQAHRDAEGSRSDGRRPVPLADVMGPDDPFPRTRSGSRSPWPGPGCRRGRSSCRGRERDGVDGYWVVTPVAVGGPDAAALPVVRGGSPDPAEAPARRRGACAWTPGCSPEGTGEVDDDPATTCSRSCASPTSSSTSTRTCTAPGVAEEPGRPGQASRAAPRRRCAHQHPQPALRRQWWFFGAFAAFIWWRWVTEATPEEDQEAADRSQVTP